MTGTSAAAPRVRRPKDKEEVIQRLVDPNRGCFSEIRDVLTFAATLGYAHGRREPLAAVKEPIRWEVAKHRRGTEHLVGMLAVASNPDDKDIAAGSRLNEQIAVYEEYANGGLAILQTALDQSPLPPREIVRQLVQEALAAEDDEDDDPLGLRNPLGL